jgi:hypothetical protein
VISNHRARWPASQLAPEVIEGADPTSVMAPYVGYMCLSWKIPHQLEQNKGYLSFPSFHQQNLLVAAGRILPGVNQRFEAELPATPPILQLS